MWKEIFKIEKKKENLESPPILFIEKISRIPKHLGNSQNLWEIEWREISKIEINPPTESQMEFGNYGNLESSQIPFIG